MDKETVIKALKLATEALIESRIWIGNVRLTMNAYGVMALAGQILVSDSIRESAHPIHHFHTDNPYYQIGVDVLAKMGEKKYPQLDEPDETGYWYAVFPDGSSRLAEIEEADSSKDGVKYKVHLLDHSGETMAIKEAKWVKINPQL